MTDPEFSGREQAAEDIARVICRFLKDRLGHGPEGHRRYLIDDMIMIRLFQTLTSVDSELAKTAEGRRSVKETRDRLTQELRPALEDIIRKSTGAGVVSVHSDVSTRTGERIVIFVLDRKVRELPGDQTERSD